MTLLEKIDFLIKTSGLNKRQFSVQSKIPYTTIDGFYKKGYEGMRLSTFRSLCDFFGVTMDSMAYDEQEIVFRKDIAPQEFSPEQRRIAKFYGLADDGTKNSVAKLLDVKREIRRIWK